MVVLINETVLIMQYTDYNLTKNIDDVYRTKTIIFQYQHDYYNKMFVQ